VAFAGRGADGRVLASIAQNVCRQHRRNFGAPIAPLTLAQQMADVMYSYTSYGAYRPFGASLLVSGQDLTTGAAELYLCEVDGSFFRYFGAAIGKGTQVAKTEIEKEKRMIDLTARMGGRYCRILSGQRREDVSRADGVRYTVESIQEVIPYAAERGIILNMENHYKDGYWKYPEFAQHLDVFLEVINQIDSPWFGVNYDPSNAIICGEDPLEVLAAIKHRVITMHASDRYLISGTIEDLKQQDGSMGYAKNLRHGVIGKGLNDYDTIFSTLRAEGFNSWISIEDGENGMDELRESVRFLRRKMAEHFVD
jgi:sugar phosphate isomerase/epimerase